jgi:uncharacterized protein YjbJ (UPF0337 family)
MDENEYEGTARDIGGKVKDVVGGLTGDTKTQAEGKADQLAGKAQHAYGNATDAVSSAADDAHSTISGMAQRVSEEASGLGEKAYAQTGQAVKYVGDYLRDEPVASLIGIAVVSMLIGYLIGRPPHERAVELGRFRAAYRDR